MRKKLQLALDAFPLPEALKLVRNLGDTIDIIEAGTPFLLKYGMQAVRELKKAAPQTKLLCDGKIMDAGAMEADAMFEAGADWITVLAVTDDETIKECVRSAAEHGGKVMADMICITNIQKRVQELEDLGVDCLAVHTGVDQQKKGRTPLEDLREIKENCSPDILVAVAGGITLENLEDYLLLEPDILIVGGGIAVQLDSYSAAVRMKDKINSWDRREE